MMSSVRMLRNLYRLRKTQWMKLSELKKMQLKMLRKSLKHAYEKVGFYHELFDKARIRPNDIKSLEDIRRIPIIDKSTIVKKQLHYLIAKGIDPNKCRKYATSGSTGVPITVYCDRKTEEFRSAVFARPFFECGLGIRDKMVRITDSENWYRNWYERLGLMRKICISPNEPLEKNLTKVQEFNPDAIYGHSSYIFLLAKAIFEKKLEITPRLVIGTADLLTDKIRNFVNSVLSVEMLDFYGSAEVERMAWECREHVGYHIDVENIVFEVVDDDGENVSPGERGNVVVTSLNNYAMPFIRYNMGDSAVLTDEKCPCGRGLPLMKSLEGRANDFLKLPDGRLVSPMAFLATFDYIPGILQYRVIQKGVNRVVVEVVKGETFSEETVEAVRRETKRIMGDLFQVEVATVEEIPRERSGKTKVVSLRI